MNKKQLDIYNFLNDKKGYIKWGAKRLASYLNQNIKDIEIVLDNIKNSSQPVKSFSNEYHTPGLYLVIGCIHTPFHNKSLLNSIYQLINDYKKDIKGLVIAGDFLDMNSLSNHDKGKLSVNNITLQDEYDEGNKVLDNLTRNLDKNSTKVFIAGNHEDRYFRYMSNSDNSKLGKSLISPFKGLKLTERGFDIYLDWKKDYIKLGKYLTVCHGEFFSTHTAKKHIDAYRSSVLFYHTHRIQSYIEGKIGGYNGGCLIDLNSPAFNYASRSQINSWLNGFNIVNIDKEGYYHIQQITCYNNQFIFGNKIYKY